MAVAGVVFGLVVAVVATEAVAVITLVDVVANEAIAISFEATGGD